MRKFLIVLMFHFGFISFAQKQDVKNTIKIFFEGFHQKDSVKMKMVCSDKIIMQSISETNKGNKLRDENINKFYKSIVSIPFNLKFHEKIMSYTV